MPFNLKEAQTPGQEGLGPAIEEKNKIPATTIETEKKAETEKKTGEKGDTKKETTLLPKKRPSFLQRKTITVPQTRDEVTVKIEKIMEEGLNEAYQRLSPIAKQEFKIKGEQTALKIRDLLKAGHVKVKKILRLLLDWLRVLPGVNRFFLEQEAKIKADKIIALKKL